MIRKLISGEYRLYSSKKNPKPANAETSVLSKPGKRQNNTSAPSSTSNAIE
jgi:hypothetical protein